MMIKYLINFLCCYPFLVFANPIIEQNKGCMQEKLKIAIDIGHSPNKPGAISARGVSEYTFNKKVGELLFQNLLQHGFKSTFILNEQNPEMSLHSRAKIANQKGADLLISIHHDSVQPHYLNQWEFDGENHHYSDRFKGFSIFFSGKNPKTEQSFQLAKTIGNELLQLQAKPTLHHAENIVGENRPLIDSERGVYRFDSLILLKNTKMPAVLVECGVIVNREEEQLLSKEDHQKNLALALSKAVVQFAIDQFPNYCMHATNP
jgi:N-acetylmuramoyl-L-alanine amidase